MPRAGTRETNPERAQRKALTRPGGERSGSTNFRRRGQRRSTGGGAGRRAAQRATGRRPAPPTGSEEKAEECGPTIPQRAGAAAAALPISCMEGNPLRLLKLHPEPTRDNGTSCFGNCGASEASGADSQYLITHTVWGRVEQPGRLNLQAGPDPRPPAEGEGGRGVPLL